MSRRFTATASFALLLWTFMLWTTALSAAPLDPLLRGLLDKVAGDDAAAPFYERLIALETGPGGELRVGVILRLDGGMPDLSDVPGLVIGSVRGDIATARLPVASLGALAARDDLRRVEASTLSYPVLDMAVPAAHVDQVWGGAPAYTGDGVIVAVIDSGIDFTHEDFDHPNGSTRILNIWDLYATGTPPTGFAYGAEWSSAQIDAGTATEHDYNGHGTHVSGMAAGDGSASGGQYRGVAYEADIIFAKAFDDNQGGFPSDKTIDALNYLAAKHQQYDRPMVINMSLGGHLGAHDGTGAQEQVVDDVAAQGIPICIAAGNEGEDYLTDHGPAAGTDLIFRVMLYTANAGTENDYVLVMAYVDGATSPTVSVSLGATATADVPSEHVQSFNTTDGYVVIDNASAGVDPANGDKQILIQIDDRQGPVPSSGDWTFRVQGGSGEVHAWKIVSSMTTGFLNSDQSYSVGMPGTAAGAITLAAIKTRQQWPSLDGTASYGTGNSWGDAAVGDRAPFSSIGPTRDGRQKPDLAAPGMAIISVRSSDITPVPANNLLASGGDYYIAQGTSMACPFTTGVVALMLEKNGDLTPAQVKSYLRDNAATDAYTGATWNASWGAGKIDAAAAVAAIGGGTGPDGDVDADGNTSVIDVVLLVNYIVDPAGHPLSTEARTAADVAPAPAGNGVLDAADLARIVGFILGTDTPGKSDASPILVELGAPYADADGWWTPVTLQGDGLAAGQFALDLSGARWRDAEPRVEADGAVATASHAEAGRIRVLLYDLDNELPDALTIDLPCDGPGDARPAGLLLVDPAGEALATELATPAPAGFVRVQPNPVGAGAEVRFTPPHAGDWTLAIYDLRGRRVRTLARGEAPEAGLLDWRGEDDGGRRLPDGLYLVRLVAGDRVITSKVVLAR